MEELDVPEGIGIATRWIGEDASQYRSYYHTNVESHWQEEECARLVPVLSFQYIRQFTETKQLYLFSFTVSLILLNRSISVTARMDDCWNELGGTHMVRITPTLPLVMPPRDLKNNACQNVVEKPKPRQDNTAAGQDVSTDPITR